MQPATEAAAESAGIDLESALAPVKKAVAQIDALERQVETVKDSEPDLSQRRAEVGAVIEDIDKAAEQLKPLIDAAKQQAAKLGPAPGKGDPPESHQVAAERKRLVGVIAALDGGLKSTELVKERSRQLSSRIQEMRHGIFAQRLFERSPSPLLPQTWQAIWNDLPSARILFLAVFGTWQTIVAERWPVAASILALAGLTYVVLSLLARRTINGMLRRPHQNSTGFMRRASAACVIAPLIALPVIAAAVITYVGFEGAGLVYSRIEEWLYNALQGITILNIAASLTTAILEPARPQWRLVNLRDSTARSLWRTAFGFAFVYAADLIAKQTIRMLVLPLHFDVALSFLTSLALALLLLRAALTRFQPAEVALPARDPETPPPLGPVAAAAPVVVLAPHWLKIPMLVVAAAILAAAMSGYVSLSRFAAGQVVVTGSAVVLALLLHLTFKTLEIAIGNSQSGVGAWLARRAGYDRAQRQLIGQMLTLVLHAIGALVLIPGLLLAWGFSSADVLSGLRSALFGFEIGRFRISVAQILLAILVFAAILLATRLLQRWLQGNVLKPERFDAGVANSIHQGLGYAGFGLALLAGVSFAGIDITNLAIVAGALSVGIGFGLQSIVNNFVSGLILLVERPIKVGDWVVVKGGGEGYVRSISVRSTEIETFDRASLIVPNSELISNVVTNWTHRNALGRVVIKVSASYKSDPVMVLKILNEVALASPNVMQQPPPLITLDNLGADGLEFSIRVLVADINRALGVQTVLRAAVVQAFRQHGIEFPTPERDLYLRDLDGIKVIIAKVLEDRARQQASAAEGAGHVFPEAAK